jgi:hypothetical protein
MVEGFFHRFSSVFIPIRTAVEFEAQMRVTSRIHTLPFPILQMRDIIFTTR